MKIPIIKELSEQQKDAFIKRCEEDCNAGFKATSTLLTSLINVLDDRLWIKLYLRCIHLTTTLSEVKVLSMLSYLPHMEEEDADNTAEFYFFELVDRVRISLKKQCKAK